MRMRKNVLVAILEQGRAERLTLQQVADLTGYSVKYLRRAASMWGIKWRQTEASPSLRQMVTDERLFVVATRKPRRRIGA